ncbi:cytochrome P450 4V2 [Caerostris extrusa]|uniref:Cytochrome P450 4V2 n=1 Tax=Caerostris extrusa TaxID=172846 RepID=A0AAV4UB64_CAEEX|nr:cytochrome P450 4V2 [Caerostris extrusa]
MGDDSRRPKCLLDVLLKLHIEDQVLDEEGVRQEVDTFIVAVCTLRYRRRYTKSWTVYWELTARVLFGRRSERTHLPGLRSKGGYTIPKRAHVVVSPFLVHRDEDVFSDPEKFDPERFLPENRNHIPECAYIPFAAGPRNCIGRIFGEMEVKVLVCHILRKFSLHSLDSRDQVLPLIKVTLQSSQPTRIKFDAENSPFKNLIN